MVGWVCAEEGSVYCKQHLAAGGSDPPIHFTYVDTAGLPRFPAM